MCSTWYIFIESYNNPREQKPFKEARNASADTVNCKQYNISSLEDRKCTSLSRGWQTEKVKGKLSKGSWVSWFCKVELIRSKT